LPSGANLAERILTDRACKGSKARKSIHYLNDGAGLRLQVRPNGTKYWMLRYHLAGRESTFQLGKYPDVTLEKARKAASEARALIDKGLSPTVARKVAKAHNVERGEATFAAVATEWLEHNKPGWSGHHHERNEGLLRRILFPELGPLPVHEITEAMLLGALRKAYDSGIRESARRARAVAQQVFSYAKDTHRATHNPARELVGSSVLKKPEVKHFAALKPDQVGPFLRNLEGSDLEPVTKAALYVMLVTGVRDGALRPALWAEFDLRSATWTLPPERMKSGREHRVALPRQAVAMLKELAKLTNRGPDSFVFKDRKKKHLAENTLRLALHRLGFKVTAHGLRSLITDLLNERGFNADAIERQIDHVMKDKTRSAYLRTDFFDYRRPMMQWVADWAEAQKAKKADPAVPKNVVPIRKSG
jgi:integrase